MVGELVHLPCEERLTEWGLFNLGKSGKLTVAANTYKEVSNKTEPGSSLRCMAGE